MTDAERVAQAVVTLREYFDTVQILCTRDDGGRDTTFCAHGAGNWFARYGYARMFVSDAEKGMSVSTTIETKKEWEI